MYTRIDKMCEINPIPTYAPKIGIVLQADPNGNRNGDPLQFSDIFNPF